MGSVTSWKKLSIKDCADSSLLSTESETARLSGITIDMPKTNLRISWIFLVRFPVARLAILVY